MFFIQKVIILAKYTVALYRTFLQHIGRLNVGKTAQILGRQLLQHGDPQTSSFSRQSFLRPSRAASTVMTSEKMAESMF